MDRTTRSALALTAATIVGLAVIPPERPVLGSILVLIAVGLAGVAAFGRFRSSTLEPDRLFYLASVGAAVFGLIAFVLSFVRIFESGSAGWVASALLIVVLSGAMFSLVFRRPTASGWYVFIAAYGSLIVLLMALTPWQGILDVAVFQQDSVDALIRGINPYSITFPDPYTAALSERYYGAGVSVDGVLQFGYPYFPLSLFVVAPFEVVFGDFRIAHALAIVGSGELIRRMSSDPRSTVVAACFLLVSPVIYLLRFGWIDPLVVFIVIGVVYMSARGSRGTSYAVGLLFAIKQSAALFGLTSILLIPRPHTLKAIVRHFAKAGAVFVVITLPFVLWGPRDFYWSVVKLQFIQPFRADSVSLPAVFADQFEALPRIVGVGLPVAVVLGLSVLVVLKAPTGAQGFAIASGFVLLAAFVLSKQAFANYYIVAIAALSAGAAALGEDREGDSGTVSAFDRDNETQISR